MSLSPSLPLLIDRRPKRQASRAVPPGPATWATTSLSLPPKLLIDRRPKREAGQPGSATWYRRMENNEWRPVVATMLPMLAESGSEHGRAKIHYAPVVRHQQLVKHRKMRRRQWLQKAYVR